MMLLLLLACWAACPQPCLLTACLRFTRSSLPLTLPFLSTMHFTPAPTHTAQLTKSAVTHKATKRALSQLMESLAEELKEAGLTSIGVHNLSPGELVAILRRTLC